VQAGLLDLGVVDKRGHGCGCRVQTNVSPRRLLRPFAFAPAAVGATLPDARGGTFTNMG